MSVFTLENIKRLVRTEVNRANTATAAAVAKNADKISHEIADASARGKDSTTIFCPSGIREESTECLKYLNQVKEKLGKVGVPSTIHYGRTCTAEYFYMRVYLFASLLPSKVGGVYFFRTVSPQRVPVLGDLRRKNHMFCGALATGCTPALR